MATESEPARQRMPGAERRAAILRAAETAFSESVFHETSLDDVAEVAGVSKALIYEHFESKRQLYQALLTGSADELMDRVSAAAASGADRQARLRAGIEAFVGFVADHPGASRLLFHNAGDPDVVGELDRLREEAGTMIATLLSEEIPADRDEDALRPELAVAMLAHQLIGALQSLAIWWDSHPRTDRDSVVRMAMEYSWLGLDRLSRGERWSLSEGAE